MSRPEHGWTARRARWPLALAALGLLAAGWAAPAAAAGTPAGLTLTVSRPWNQSGRAGSWAPYVMTVRNDGPATWTGTAVLFPVTGYGPPSLDTFPEYDAPVTVPAGGRRTVTVYALDPGNGYLAQLRDEQGRVTTTATLPAGGGAGAAVAILSDTPQVQQRVDALLRSHSQLEAAVTQFPSALAFPTDVIRLSGLNAVVLDEFDSGTLDQSQLRALRDFVGLGGTLIVATGAGARRTLGPLPAELVPLRPTGAATASLAPVAELGGVAADATAAVTTGDLAASASVAVAAPDGTPLIVQDAYGAGEVVELTFDPLAPPFESRLDLAATAWVQALARGLAEVAGSGASQLARVGFGGGVPFGGPPTGSGPGSATGYPGYLDQALAEGPAAASPPFELLAGLLVAYVVVVSGLAYTVLRAAGRRGLLWVVVPAVAIACTAGAYLAGFGTRGSDFQVVQVQVERLAPGGVVENAEFDGVVTPRRGDVTVTAPPGSLVTTAKSMFGPFQLGGDAARIAVASSPRATFPNVPVWDIRPLQTLTVTHDGDGGSATMPIEARLGLRAGRLQGQVANHTPRPVRNLQIVSPDGAHTVLAGSIAAGASAAVDVPMPTAANTAMFGKIGAGFTIPLYVYAAPTAPTARQAMVTLAASEVAVRPGEWALVGEVDRTDTLRVGGEQPHGTGRALVVEPVRLASADSAAGAAPPRLVSSYTTAAGVRVDVYEQHLPQGLTGRLALGTSLLPGRPPAVTPSLEVYDWDAGTWRALSGIGASGSLTAGEVRGGLVRARVASEGAQVVLSLSDAP